MVYPVYTTKGRSINLLFMNYGKYIPANIYLFKILNRNTTKRCEICSKLTFKTPERRLDVVLLFLLLALNIFYTFYQSFY